MYKKEMFRLKSLLTPIRVCALCAFTLYAARADTWTDPDTGYTWTYRTNGDETEIFEANPSQRVAILPRPIGSVTIPSTLGGKPVTSIGSDAFYNCVDMTSVIIPDSVTSIRGAAFEGCSSLVNVRIPDGVRSIEAYTFFGCSGLTSVMIPDGVMSVGPLAFWGCSSLTNVTIPNSVTNIDFQAFECCNGLNVVTILDGVKSIGDAAFRSCDALTNVTIGAGVTTIGYSAFEGCSSLTNVMIPNGVTTIWDRAFFGCCGLMSAGIPNSVTWIGEEAFSGCSGLAGMLMIPDSVTRIGQSAFMDCSGLTCVTIPESVTSIKAGAFYGCNGLTNMTIPDSVTSIGNRAFGGCTGLTSVVMGNCVTNIGEFVFNECSALTHVVLPKNLTQIESYIFYGCTNLTWVTIPQCLCDNGLSAIPELKRIREVVIHDGVTNIGASAFSGCGSLSSVTIPNSVTNIGNNAFNGCTNLISVTIPDSVTNVGESAFEHCSGLTSVMISDNVMNIGSYAFFCCTSLTNIIIPSSVTSIEGSAFYNCSGLTNVAIPDSVTNIGPLAFCNCTNLTSVAFPNHLTSIESYAFEGCSGFTSVTIPNSVADIGDGAFDCCSGLTSVMIPSSVQHIGYHAFGGCPNLRDVHIDGLAAWCRIDFGGYWGVEAFDSPMRFVIDGVPVTDMVIPDGVENIAPFMFSRCSELHSVKIPMSVTNIGERAFGYCSNLVSVTIPNSVKKIENHAFDGCISLCDVTIPQCALGNLDGVFPLAYSNLTHVLIAEGVESVGYGAFQRCTSLSSVSIPTSVTNIAAGAFSGCGDAIFDTNSVPFVKVVDGWAVDTISSSHIGTNHLDLTGLRGVANEAFNNVDIGYVTISESMKYIGHTAFSHFYLWHCGLYLHILGGRPTFAEDAFKDINVVVFVDEDNSEWLEDGVLPESFAVGSSAVKLCPWNVQTLTIGIEPGQDFYYDGTKKRPALAYLYDNPKILEIFGAEYDIEYFDNVNAGTGRVVITGKNGFPGRAEYTFTIEKATVYPPYISGKTYAGGTMTADVPSSDPWRVVSNDGGVDAGDYDVTLELTDPANYKWSGSDSAQVTRTFTIGRKSINGASVELGPSLTFTGEMQTQTVHGVTLNGVAVTFDVSDNDVRDVGTYTLTVYGMGNYMGSAQASFSVAQMVIDPPTLAEKAYTGGNLTADVPESQWYTVSANFGGTDPGIYWVMLTLADEANTRWSTTDDRIAVVPFEIVSGGSPGGDDPAPPSPPAPATYAVTYRPGTYGTGALQTATKTEGVALALKGAIFTREGYTQTGWATSDGGAKAYGLGASYTTNAALTLYPFWTKNASPEPAPPSVNAVTVTFNANGGSGDATRQVEKGAAIGELPTAKRKGYTFAGWWTATEKATAKTKVTKNVTYYAKWTANKYKIKFNKNGGKGTMKTLSATYGKKVTLTANAFKRTNCTFAGWSKTKSGAVAYKNKAKVKNLTTVSGKTVSLYAVWKKPSYTVKFNANGGTGAAMRQAIECSSKTALAKNTYVREGFVFAGWATKKNGPVVYKNKAKVKDLAKKGKTVTLYAVWRPAKWAVGTFTGEGNVGGQATLVALTVASSGKISGKFVLAKNFKAYSFKAGGFDGFSDGALRASASLTFGKKKCTLEIAVGRSDETGEAVPVIDVTYKGKEYGWGFVPPS